MALVGILGGTFNPPHIAHLVCAQEVLDQLALDRVILMPAGMPPHKQVDHDPGPHARVALCRLAVAGDRRFAVSTIEIDRAGPSYTVDTLRELHEREPGDELTFIVGGDMAESLPSWREPEEVLRLARLAVAERAGTRREDLASRIAPLHDGSRVTFIDMPRLDVSSSSLRSRIAAGRPIRYLVPDAVATEIAANGWYRGPATPATATTDQEHQG